VKARGRTLLVLAGTLYLVLTVIWAGAERRSPRQFLAAGSSLNDGEKGTSLARAYLRARRGGSAAVLARPVSTELPANGVVFRLEPELLPWRPRLPEVRPKDKGKEKKKDGKAGDKRTPEKSAKAKAKAPGQGAGKEKTEDDDEEEVDDLGTALDSLLHPGRFAPLLTSDEEEWVRGGGRLVLGIAGHYGPVWTAPEATRTPLEKVFPLWPEVARLRLPVRRTLRGPALARASAVILAGEGPVLAFLPLGRGDVVLLSCPEIFHNGHLAAGDHLALLEALALAARPAFFDERAHGIGANAGVLPVLRRWGLGPALLLAGLAVLAAFWRQAVRVGPPERAAADLRSEAVDLVDSLGELYDRGLSKGDAIRLYWEGFVHAVGVETGLSGARLAARAGELAGGFAPPPPGEDLSAEGFDRALAALNMARRRARDGQHDRE
jgi:hypothetical protein